MTPSLGRVIIYTKKIEAMVDFYCRYFGYEAVRREGDRIVELRPKNSGIPLLLHLASKGQKEGQSLVKLVFDVSDVEAFCDLAKDRGLEFGKIHQADGYCFANAKDPSKNSVSVSNRAFRP
ncbi:Glyoxalase-like domain protein [Thalassovita gelatinovora]|uniref:Glyoxalase-like domain protein n=1 Tax=Thalassovita gelatinovora TaxID=53501 RepID=A0A0P1F644_THAGE|nr:VOC family protein [Thalassovita gelatinovora]QIZ80917.1 glyoxalase/bleomycin resistance/dioxygenase family protein [Thalassovita gelatinovora]CUH63413.1 Glyoxalase-like domain protein [Thalassovita gelatinovora]SEQ66613.1 Glyoxalase/Bleomycin resistance protein/Dioxygenase superfamily protein [Thalassovita gelatinovora]